MPTHRSDVSLLSAAQFQQLTGRDLQTIRKAIAKAGIQVAQMDGRSKLYPANKVLDAVYERKDPYAEKNRLDRVRADRSEFDLSVVRGEFAPLVIISQVIAGFGEYANSVLDSLPLRLKKRCPKLTARDIETVRREIVKVQNEISEASIDSSGIVKRRSKKS